MMTKVELAVGCVCVCNIKVTKITNYETEIGVARVAGMGRLLEW